MATASFVSLESSLRHVLRSQVLVPTAESPGLALKILEPRCALEEDHKKLVEAKEGGKAHSSRWPSHASCFGSFFHLA